MNKHYPTKQGRHYVFKDVSINLPTDVNIGILGPNGAGKSTLIRMLGGADYPSSGMINSPKKISWPLALQGGLQGSMSARENVRFVARIHGVKHTQAIENKVADFAQIGHFFNEPVKTYSSGMKAKVAFGLTMAFDFDFDVLLIDEIGAVGDANFRKKSQALLESKFEKTKLIMVSHSMGELRKYCQAGLVIKNKDLVYFSNLADAITEYEETYASVH